MARRFDILDRNTRQYRRYNDVGRQITARLTPPSDNSDPVTHFLGSVNDLFQVQCSGHAGRKREFGEDA